PGLGCGDAARSTAFDRTVAFRCAPNSRMLAAAAIPSGCGSSFPFHRHAICGLFFPALIIVHPPAVPPRSFSSIVAVNAPGAGLAAPWPLPLKLGASIAEEVRCRNEAGERSPKQEVANDHPVVRVARLASHDR